MSNTLSKIEKRTAYALTLPAVLIVFAIVLFPIFSNVWISFKEVQLKDIRIPEPRAKKIVKSVKNEDSKIKIIYKLRNSSLIQDIRDVKFQDKFPNNVQPVDLDARWKFISNKVQCDFGDWSKKYREQLVIFFKDLLLTTFYYTFFGTIGAIVFGILSAQMVNQNFRGRSFIRSTLLFPYVAPVVALAFTWELLLDPNSGTLNNLLLNYNIIDKPINLLGQKYVSIFVFGFEFKLRLALTTVIIFEIWRYFPLAFLFILARLQAVPKELYEAADIDGAGPYTKFMNITLPQITAVISILFMIRFIWNFNKFEDIFLLTGGASGTRTLPINVYEQGFSIGDIGMGSAVSMVIVLLLLFFMLIYFKLIGKRANES